MIGCHSIEDRRKSGNHLTKSTQRYLVYHTPPDNYLRLAMNKNALQHALSNYFAYTWILLLYNSYAKYDATLLLQQSYGHNLLILEYDYDDMI